MKFQRYSTAEDTYTTLPATFQTSGADAENYQVYGKTVENLADAIIEHANISQDGRIFDPGAIDPAGDTFVLYIAPVVSGKTYTITTSTYDSAVVYAFYSTQPAYDAVSYNNARTVLEGTHQATITAPITGWIAFRDYVTAPAGMIVEGSTPAPIYVPPGASGGVGEATSGDEPQGYKIPILNTSGVTENVLIDDPYKTSYYINENGQETAQGGFSIYATEKLDTSLGEYSFYFAEYGFNTTVRVHGYSNGVWQQQITTFANTHSATITKPQGIDEIRISCANGYTGRTLVKGSTPPDHYIPHRYESNYDLFIGSTKLYEEEYLDYQEQKVYKRTEQLFDKDATDTENGYKYRMRYLYDPETGITSIGSNANWNLSEYIRIEPNSNYYYLPNAEFRNISLAILDSQKNVTRYIQYNNRDIIFFSTNSEEMFVRLSLRTTVLGSIAFYKDIVPETYIPYLQPTDPPAPFPTITTYIGENNLSVDTTVQPAKVVLEYAGWREIDAKKYVNGEWVTITPKQYTGGSWS